MPCSCDTHFTLLSIAPVKKKKKKIQIQNSAPPHCALQNELLLGLCVNTIRSCCAGAGDTEPNRKQRQQMTPCQASVDETCFCLLFIFLMALWWGYATVPSSHAFREQLIWISSHAVRWRSCLFSRRGDCDTEPEARGKTDTKFRCAVTLKKVV